MDGHNNDGYDVEKTVIHPIYAINQHPPTDLALIKLTADLPLIDTNVGQPLLLHPYRTLNGICLPKFKIYNNRDELALMAGYGAVTHTDFTNRLHMGFIKIKAAVRNATDYWRIAILGQRYPQYNGTFSCPHPATDLALVKLTADLPLIDTNTGQPLLHPYRGLNGICLPMANQHNDRDELALMAGYGGVTDTEYSNRLRMGYIRIKAAVRNATDYWRIAILGQRYPQYNGTFSCPGDSGAPLYHLSPEIYSAKIQGGANLNAIESITEIKDITTNKKSYDLIVDLGCADGRITKHLLGKQIPHKLLVGIDVVPDMISYARQHNSDETIEYLLQDMSVKWPEMSPRIRQLESKVDLIFSNFTLQYMPDKWQLMATCNRLLTASGSSSSSSSSGGIFHANVIILPDLNKKLVSNTTNSPDKQWYQTREKQLDDWRQSLADNHFLIHKFQIIDSIWPTDRQRMIELMPVMLSNYRSFFKNQSDFDSELNDHLTDTVFDAYVNPDSPEPNPRAWQQFLADPTVTEVNIYLRVLRITAVKE
ncbi:uncharacterized protein LOC128954132 [Oppia nitens]|uniref:uncharacterized protein LOC128954132 n=1 Tax=Oppia nitens TaxID=1686743 RepID=UPI0023DB238B|nr:uncharacterized protein LOC128954132 [Oppia nitens]